MAKIKMDSAVSQQKTMAVTKDSVLECTKVSESDVYSHVITTTASGTVHQETLSLGESCFAPRGTLRIIIFRENTGSKPWQAEFDLDKAP